jgi:hypothetical protein
MTDDDIPMTSTARAPGSRLAHCTIHPPTMNAPLKVTAPAAFIASCPYVGMRLRH